MKSICSIIIIKCNVTQSISNTLRNEMGDINEVDRNVTLSSRSRIDRPYFWLYLPCDGVHGLLPHLSIAQGLVGVSYILVVSDFLLSPEWKTTHITYNNSPHTMTLVIML